MTLSLWPTSPPSASGTVRRLRASLRPLDGLTALMKRVDLLQPGERVTVEGSDDVARVIQTFNDMLDRLETERGTSSARALAALEANVDGSPANYRLFHAATQGKTSAASSAPPKPLSR